ncbi:hypothetical protein ACOMHN_026619 [Nucella lapillus]
MGHAEDGSIKFAALALTEESTDKLSEERQELEWKCNDCEATALTEAFLEWNPTFPEETTSMDVSVEEELMNASTSSASFQVPVKVQEISLADDPVITEPIMEDQPVTFEIIARGTQRGQPLLVDSEGFTYGIHRQSKDGATHWRCTRRRAACKCQVMVRQEGDIFTRGTQEHLHAAESEAAVKAKLVRNVKETAAAAPYQSAYTIAEHLLQESRPIPNQRSTISAVLPIITASKVAHAIHRTSALNWICAIGLTSLKIQWISMWATSVMCCSSQSNS